MLNSTLLVLGFLLAAFLTCIWLLKQDAPLSNIILIEPGSIKSSKVFYQNRTWHIVLTDHNDNIIEYEGSYKHWYQSQTYESLNSRDTSTLNRILLSNIISETQTNLSDL